MVTKDHKRPKWPKWPKTSAQMGERPLKHSCSERPKWWVPFIRLGRGALVRKWPQSWWLTGISSTNVRMLHVFTVAGSRHIKSHKLINMCRVKLSVIFKWPWCPTTGLVTSGNKYFTLKATKDKFRSLNLYTCNKNKTLNKLDIALLVCHPVIVRGFVSNFQNDCVCQTQYYCVCVSNSESFCVSNSEQCCVSNSERFCVTFRMILHVSNWEPFVCVKFRIILCVKFRTILCVKFRTNLGVKFSIILCVSNSVGLTV